MLKKLLLSTIVLFLCTIITQAQDVIYKKGGEKIKCKITQVTPEEITYKIIDEVDGPLYTIDKAKILKVIYQSGRVETYVSNASINDPELYADQLKRAIKINLFSPQFGYFTVGYEKNIKPGKGYEVELAVLGAGRNRQLLDLGESGFIPGGSTERRNAFGIAVNGGYKFNKMPNYISRGNRYAHIMQGSYIKPNATVGVYKENYFKYASNGIYEGVKKRTVVYSFLGLDLGRQWIFGEKFLLDFSGNIGYVVDNKKDSNQNFSEISNNFTTTRLGSGAGIGVGFKVKVGILIK